MSDITIGPFFCNSPQIATPSASMTHLGVQLEWASSAKAVQIQLFHQPHRGKLRLEHILFAPDKLDFDVPYAEHQVVKTAEGLFLPLEGLLVGLYDTHQVSRNIEQVLDDLAAITRLETKVSRLISKPGYLVGEVEAQGFVLNTVIPDGDQLYAEIAWRSKTGGARFHTAICRFQLNPDGFIDEGTWLPAGTVTVGTLLARNLHYLVPGPPRAAFSPEGISLLQIGFRWPMGYGAKTGQTEMANEKPEIGVNGPL